MRLRDRVSRGEEWGWLGVAVVSTVVGIPFAFFDKTLANWVAGTVMGVGFLLLLGVLVVRTVANVRRGWQEGGKRG